MARWLLPVLLLAACSAESPRVRTPDASPDGSDDAATPRADAATPADGDPGGDGHPASDAGPGRPDGATPPDDAGTGYEGPYPFRTRGRYVVDSEGRRVKLASVNWYGASDVKRVVSGLDTAKLADIVAAIRALGFNSVRLPFANKMLHESSFDAAAVSANPELAGLTPLEVYDRVVRALTDAGIFVLLNNHTTNPMWCCNFDSDGLWYTSDYSEEQWLDDWSMMAARYRGNLRVIAADLRNEVRTSTLNPLLSPTWAGVANDWRAAAERAGARVLEANPDLLVVVEGVNFPRVHLQGVGADPIRLPLPHRLIYAAHNYGYIGPELNGTQYGQMDWPTYQAQMDKEWGYVIQENRAFTAPVWVSEFGEGTGSTPWFENIVRYLREGDFDFAYWALNPGPKPSGEDEPYGLLARDWVTPLDDFRTQAMRSLVAPVRGPGVEPGWEDDPAHHLDALLFSDWDTQRTEPSVDWQSGTFKATCGEGARMVGLSAISRTGQRLGHIALCSSFGGGPTGARTLVANGGGDSPDATAATGGADWAVGATKLACPVGQRMVGISQSRTAVVYRIEGILCEAGGAVPSGCQAVDFQGQNGRRAETGGDWDPGGEKGQCSDGEYAAGVGLSNGTPRALLCCAP